MAKYLIPEINPEKYNYSISESRIAYHLADNRESANCLVYKDKSILDTHFSEIENFIDGNSLLIINDTKVFKARMILHKETGARVEIFLISPFNSNDYANALSQKAISEWKVMVGGKKIKNGQKLYSQKDKDWECEIISRDGNIADAVFKWKDNITFQQKLDKVAQVPLPPYIKRETEESDQQDYQTVFAEKEGSVAAPTAGLHFTDTLLDKLQSRGVVIEKLTLHVGLGTFKPLASNDISLHEMHSEQFHISKKCLESIIAALQQGRQIVAVGTTSVRTLESLFWIGHKIFNNQLADIALEQWYPYRIDIIETKNYRKETKIQYLEALLNEGLIENGISGYTNLIIVPGYKFNLVDAMITNFHLPDSTLILLVAAFLGDEAVLKVYNHAIDNNYMFYSYGDGSLLFRGND